MKIKIRRISFVMVIVLLLTAVPIYRNDIYLASENIQSDVPNGMKSEAEMMELALEYFPEYAERLNDPIEVDLLQSRAIGNEDELVINESRDISDVEHIIYQEYASGRSNILYIVDVDEVLTQNGNGHQMYKCINIEVYSRLLLGNMYIMDFAFTIYYDQYDRINDYGDFSASNLPITIERQKMIEDANGPATILYTATFQYPEFSFVGSGVQRCALEIIVGDNGYSVEAY